MAITNIQARSSKCLFNHLASCGDLPTIFPSSLDLILVSNPVLHGCSLTLRKTQSQASHANFRCVVENKPKIDKTINEAMQNICSFSLTPLTPFSRQKR